MKALMEEKLAMRKTAPHTVIACLDQQQSHRDLASRIGNYAG